MASAMSANLWQPEGAYDSLATITVPSGGAASITFTGIPSTYKHLQLRGILKQTVAQNWTQITFNGDTNGSNYRAHQMNGNGSSVSASASTLGIQHIVGLDQFGGYVTDILDYTNTNKYTTVRNIGGVDQNGNGQLGLTSGLWMNTNAVNEVTVTPGSGVFTQYSSFALYGVR